MRKMTTLRTIAAVSPIPNADRLELYTVDGWHVVGQKGEFKVGEKVFYAEIDSMLPLSDERFAFLAPRGEKLAISPYTGEEGRYHRLKTAKLRGQISQGLIFPAEELPDEDGDYSKALGIFKYEPPETAEGVIGDMPGWIEKTDEERCLAGRTKIATDQGDILLSTIVNRKMKVNVKSVDNEGGIVYRPITNYQKLRTTEPLLDISFRQYKPNSTRTNRIICTHDHKIMTASGEYVQAQDLREGDEIIRTAVGYSEEALPIIMGMLLGDGCVQYDKRHEYPRARFSYTQGEAHSEYFNLITSTLKGGRKYVCKSGYTGKYNINKLCFDDPCTEVSLRRMGALSRERGFVVSQDFCAKMTAQTLAIWFMDDGSLRHRDGGCQRPTGEIATCSFAHDEIEMLSKTLKESFGVDNAIHNSARDGETIYISADGVETLATIIAPFVPSDMRYKLPIEIEKAIAFDSAQWVSFDLQERLTTTRIETIQPFVEGAHHIATNGFVYDITVQDTHNFFANGAVVHNCQNLTPELWEQFQSYPDWVATEKIDGESTTIYVEYENGEFHRGVCGRNKEFEERPGEIHWKLARTPMINNMSPIDYLENLCTRDALGQGSDFKVSYVLQGELFGPGIQQNRLGVGGKQILFFNLVKNGKRIPLHEIYHYFDDLLAVWVPRHIHVDFPKTIEQAIKQPDGIKSLVKGAKPSAQIEGFVWRCETNSATEGGEKLSFKAISNVYLLQEGD